MEKYRDKIVTISDIIGDTLRVKEIIGTTIFPDEIYPIESNDWDT